MRAHHGHVTAARGPGCRYPGAGQATAGLACSVSFSADVRTARAICSTVGRLHRNVTVSAASAPSAAPKKNPYAQWKLAVPVQGAGHDQRRDTAGEAAAECLERIDGPVVDGVVGLAPVVRHHGRGHREVGAGQATRDHRADDEQRRVMYLARPQREQLEDHVARVRVDHRFPAADELGDVAVDRPEQAVRQGEPGEADHRRGRPQAHRLRERVVVRHPEQRAADVQGILDADPLGLRRAPHLPEVVVPQRGRVAAQVTGAVLVPVQRVDLLRPPVLGRVLQEQPGQADAEGHDAGLDPDVGLQRGRAHRDRAAAAAGGADGEDERHRAIGPAAVDEPGPPALLLRVPLGHDVDAAGVDHPGADAAQHRVPEVGLPDRGRTGPGCRTRRRRRRCRR